MKGHRGNFSSKKHILEKLVINRIIFLISSYAFADTNTVILKKQKYPLKCVCMYQKNNPNGEFLSKFSQVSKFVLH